MNQRFTIILLVLSTKLFAQDYILEFGNDKVFLPTSVVIDKIIDVRPNQNCIGFVYTGALNKQTPAYLNKSLPSNLSRNIISSLCTQQSSCQHYIIRINKFIIYERRYSNMEIAICEVNLDFIHVKQGKYYKSYEAGVKMISNSSIDVTKSHQSNIQNAIKNCFDQFTWVMPNHAVEIPKEKLHNNDLNNRKYPIQQAVHPQKGLYYSFRNFRENKPDTTQEYTIKYKKSKDNLNVATLDDSQGKRIKDIWGFSDGNSIFMNVGNKLISLTHNDNIYSVYANPPEYASKLTGASIAGGLILSSLYAANVDKVKYNIDFSTGGLYLESNANEPKFESTIIVMSSDYNDQEETIQLILNSQLNCNLKAGTFRKLTFNSDKEQTEIVVKTGNKTAIINSAPLLFNSELYLIQSKKNKLTIKKPPSEIKEDLLKDIESGKFTEVVE